MPVSFGRFAVSDKGLCNNYLEGGGGGGGGGLENEWGGGG